jgi:hypothetical protein
LGLALDDDLLALVVTCLSIPKATAVHTYDGSAIVIDRAVGIINPAAGEVPERS